MISKEMYRLLNLQINAEIWSSYLYLSMSLHAEAHGYRGISNWFYVQSREELDHSRMLQKYLMAKDMPVNLLPLADVPMEWTSPLAMFQSALSHEQVITRKINDIMHQAQQERDYATASFISWYVDEQVEEEENCTDLVQQFQKVSEAPCLFMQIDYELQKRKYEPIAGKQHGGKWYA